MMANRDQADFGLGSVEDDTSRLQALHDALQANDWLGVIGRTTGGMLAVSDYKGRLLFASAAPDRWNTDVTAMPDIARAMQPTGVTYAGAIARGNDKALLASGVIGAAARPDWVLMFIRQFNAAKAVQGLFIQVIDAPQLLRDVEVSPETLTAIVAPNGDATDTMPRPLVAAALHAAREHHKVGAASYGGTTWFVHTSDIGDLGSDDDRPLAALVMASPIHADGLFASARLVFAIALAALGALALAAFFISNRSARMIGRVTVISEASNAPPGSR
jgi:hypothetical protein